MDWPGMLLITYAFGLALLLTVIILRSTVASKGRYQKMLDEKEQKLAAMQLDTEESLEVLGEQAAALEQLLNEARRQEREASLATNQRLLELQGAVVSLQSRLLRLEQGMEELKRAAAARPEPAPQPEPAPEPPVQATPAAPEPAPVQPAPEAVAEPPAPPKRPRGRPRKAAPPPEPPAPVQEEPQPDLHQQAKVIFEAGLGAGDVSRQLGCSIVEASMMYNQWEKGYLQ